MSATEHSFRGAMFGGFNRQDVMNYIEATSREHSSRTAQLKAALDAEAVTRKSLEQKLAAAQQSQTENGTRAQTAEEHLAATNAKYNAEKAELEEKSIRLASAERELTDLREQVARMAPAAIAYEGLKDRSVTIELEAHNRAQTIVSEAQAAAKETQEKLTEWAEKLCSGYNRLQNDVSATLSHADGELARAQKSLGGVSAEFAEYEAAFQKILEEGKLDAAPKKAPAPLPLDGAQ